MRLRLAIVILAIVLMAVFTALNWQAFAAPTTLDLFFAQVHAPLGMVLLGVLVITALAFVAYMSYWQGTVLVEMRRHNKELHQQRALAEQEEQSRLHELRTQLTADVARLDERMARTQDDLTREIRENGNSLAAALAEMDQRLGGAAVRADAPPQHPATLPPLV